MTDVQSLSGRVQVYVTNEDRAICDLARVVQELCKAIGELQRQYAELIKAATGR